jgi:hypothetical protein
VLAYVRFAGPDDDGQPAALVALNFGNVAAAMELPDARGGATWRVALSTADRPAQEPAPGTMRLGPLEALILLAG